ncbi:hypothetical protein CBR_g230 [Chara braunii]|uniref:Elongator complex protein 1 n=1 Tax=Chara braunii TaxID=69332 RepID=A0A388JLY3_CHABU|nr:hypothetical protein CBR_g230 [Chara braunii]|eukprot:GBG58830.1 hypothetical protein CBR_g230 [Chara braunii]
MRNLFIIAESQVRCQLLASSQCDNHGRSDKEDRLVWLTINPENSHVYAATIGGMVFGFRRSNPSEILFEFSLLSPKGGEETGGLEDQCEHQALESFVDRIKAFEYLVEEEALLVAMEAGELLLLHLEQHEIECVGLIQGGIAGLSWSPDGEVFVVTTLDRKLLMMTKEWEVLAEVDMESGQQSQRVCDVRISWRGDGKYFATLSGAGQQETEGDAIADVDQSSGRSAEIWEREGCVLHSCTEKMKSLMCPVAWRANGSLIAVARKGGSSCQQVTGGRGSSKVAEAAADGEEGKNGVEVVFFERNGLRRGGFWLDRTLEDGYLCVAVDQLSWNMDSELLLVIVRGKERSYDIVQVWFRNNYHWYMKLEWRFGMGLGVHAFWDAERPLRLHVWTAVGTYRCIDLGWDSAVERRDQGGSPTAAVIDGRFLRITPLANSLIPPPMSAAVIVHSACVRCASVLSLSAGLRKMGTAVPESNCSSMVAAVLSDGSLAIQISGTLSWISEEDVTSENSQESVVEDEWGGAMLSAERVDLNGHRVYARELAWLSPHSVLMVVSACDVTMQGEECGGSYNAVDSASRVGDSDGDLLVEVLLLSEEGGLEERGEGGDARKQWRGTVVRETRTRLPVVRLLRDDVSSWAEGTPPPSSVDGCSRVLVEIEDGSVDTYLEGVGLIRRKGEGLNAVVESFPERCPWIAAASFGKGVDPQICVIGLSGKGLLYLGKRVLAEDCVTFAVHFGSLATTEGAEGSGGAEEWEGEEQEAVCNVVFTTRRDVMYVLRLGDWISASFPGLGLMGKKTNGVRGEGNFTMLTGDEDLTEFVAKESVAAVGKVGSKMAQSKERGCEFTTRTVWERGARIVAALGGKEAGVIVQTVRGNLETVFPRALVLEEVGRAIRTGNYGRAMEMARRHRLDLNVLVDYGGWRSFLKRGVERFLNAVGNLRHVSELVLALNSSNVMEGVYHGYISSWDGGVAGDHHHGHFGANGINSHGDVFTAITGGKFLSSVDDTVFENGKVHAICKAIRQTLLQKGQDEDFGKQRSRDLELCVLTTLARSDPPELEEALRRIKLIKEGEFGKTIGQQEEEEEGSHMMRDKRQRGLSTEDALKHLMLIKEGEFGKTIGQQEEEEEGSHMMRDKRQRGLSTEDALKHLMVLTDSNRLFDTALGIYDLHLAAMVASHSQRDPKEFLPFLQELEAMPPPLLRYTIDKKLNRMDSALRNLAEAGPAHHKECVALVRTHVELFPVAMELFSRNEVQRNAVLEAWADHMLSEGRHSNAALAYSSCRQWSKAMTAYRAGGNWRGVLSLAGKLGFKAKELQLLAMELRDELKAMGHPADAARISTDYLDDTESATALLIEAREWMEALRVGYLCRQKPGTEAGTTAEGVADIVETRVAPVAVETARVQIADFDEEAERVEKYLRRWRDVHTRRLQLAARLASERDRWEAAEGRGDDDAESVTDSVGSDLSAYESRTTGSSVSGSSPSRAGTSSASSSGGKQLGKRASRRAAKRAAKGGRIRIRAGSPGEELALLEYVKGLSITARVQEEIGQLSEVLVLLGKEGLAGQLQHRVGEFMEVLQKAVQEMASSIDQESTGSQVKVNGGVEQPQQMDHVNSTGHRPTIGRVLTGNGNIEGKSKAPTGADDGAQWRWAILDVHGRLPAPSS